MMIRKFKKLVKNVINRIVIIFILVIIYTSNNIYSQYEILSISYCSQYKSPTLSINHTPDYYQIIIEAIPISDDNIFLNTAHTGYYLWSKDQQYLFLFERDRLIPKIHYLKRENNGALKVLKCDGYQPGELLYPSLQVYDTITRSGSIIEFEEIEDFYKKLKK